jgi:hypothetical protein
MHLFHFILVISLSVSWGFVPTQTRIASVARLSMDEAVLVASQGGRSTTKLYKKISQERRKQLGILDTEDEYDLDFALNNNTDDTISKVVAGSLIVVMVALLTVGVIIPYTTDFGEGVCNPILSQGRC